MKFYSISFRMLDKIINNSENYTLSLLKVEMPLDIVIIGSCLYLIIFLFGIIGNLIIICVLTKG
jgi:hypothetical protein